MHLPQELWLVRHGRSFSNDAFHKAHQAMREQRPLEEIEKLFEELYRYHTADIPLMPEGVEQARKTGEWIRKSRRDAIFDRYYTTSFLRGFETALHMNLQRARWFPVYSLREVNWGDMDHLPPWERTKRWPEFEARYERSPVHEPPIGGESIADACTRIFPFLNHIGREYREGSVICVAHYQIIQAARIMIENISPADFRLRKEEIGLGNCDVLVYERQRTGLRYSTYSNATGDVSVWKPVVREGFSNDDMARIVHDWKQI